MSKYRAECQHKITRLGEFLRTHAWKYDSLRDGAACESVGGGTGGRPTKTRYGVGFCDLTNLFVLSRSVVGAIDTAGLTPSLTGRVRSDPIGWTYKLAQELWRETTRVRRLREGWVILPYSLRTCLKNLATAAGLAASESDQNEAVGQDARKPLDRGESSLPPQPEVAMSPESGAPAESPDAVAPAPNPLDLAAIPNPSAPLTLTKAAQAWGGSMTAHKLKGLMTSGTVRYQELNRQLFVFYLDDAPNLPAK